VNFEYEQKKGPQFGLSVPVSLECFIEINALYNILYASIFNSDSRSLL